MRCLTCQSLSFQMICKDCQENYLEPSFFKRELEKDFFVYSFYKLEEIKELINTKYEFYGDRVFNILAKNSFAKFSSNFNFSDDVYSIAIDDHTRHQFSQTAILVKHTKSEIITPLYDTLKATNIVKYAGKDLKFRKKNKRDFIYKGHKNIQVILIDDLVTTGSTILEAKDILERDGCEVLFSLCLCDAKVE
ncbi:MAG: phosphoribosyltransferase family protein [Campylobacterota bacterium]|nr:phosphoribosyltransferase family protein [Campylobacterota bacterium]